MSDIGDALRAFAAECDGIPKLRGVIFAKTGNLRINLVHADARSSDRDILNGLLIAATQTAKRDEETATRIQLAAPWGVWQIGQVLCVPS